MIDFNWSDSFEAFAIFLIFTLVWIGWHLLVETFSNRFLSLRYQIAVLLIGLVYKISPEQSIEGCRLKDDIFHWAIGELSDDKYEMLTVRDWHISKLTVKDYEELLKFTFDMGRVSTCDRQRAYYLGIQKTINWLETNEYPIDSKDYLGSIEGKTPNPTIPSDYQHGN